MSSFKFWKTQPVPQFNDIAKIDDGPIEVIRPDQVQSKPETIAEGYEWTTIDLGNETELSEVYQLLADHYATDSGDQFRFNYSPAFLDW